jgi:sugar phosphate isomerase/epimerase
VQLSIATANLYYLSFEQAIEIIAEAGFQNIELDLYWARKDWAMAQHLKDMPARQVIRCVDQSGLKISSLHDTGGVLENDHSTLGFINPILDQYLEAMGYAPDCLVFHTPHIEGNPDSGWWEQISGEVVRALEKYHQACACITLENMPFMDGYFVPLPTPEKLSAFVSQNDLYVTFDTTHYAQMGTGIIEAARNLGKSIKTIHLSDYKDGRSHVFIGEGELDLPGFFDTIDQDSLNTVTLECSLSSPGHPDQQMSSGELVSRLREARTRLESLLCN